MSLLLYNTIQSRALLQKLTLLELGLNTGKENNALTTILRGSQFLVVAAYKWKIHGSVKTEYFRNICTRLVHTFRHFFIKGSDSVNDIKILNTVFTYDVKAYFSKYMRCIKNCVEHYLYRRNMRCERRFCDEELRLYIYFELCFDEILLQEQCAIWKNNRTKFDVICNGDLWIIHKQPCPRHLEPLRRFP